MNSVVCEPIEIPPWVYRLSLHSPLTMYLFSQAFHDHLHIYSCYLMVTEPASLSTELGTSAAQTLWNIALHLGLAMNWLVAQGDIAHKTLDKYHFHLHYLYFPFSNAPEPWSFLCGLMSAFPQVWTQWKYKMKLLLHARRCRWRKKFLFIYAWKCWP